MTRLIDLYPRGWRDRYGDELADLIAGRPLTFSDRLDLVRGILDAHRHPELADLAIPGPVLATEPVSPQRLADLRIARRLGIAAIAGLIAWFAAWIVAANGPIVQDVGFSYRDGSAAFPLYIGSLLMLAGGFVGQIVRLPSRAIVARLGAFVAAVAFGLYSFGPWNMLFAIVGLVAVTVLATAAWWGSHWSGLSATVVAIVAVAGTGLMWFALSGQASPTVDPPPSQVAGIALLGALWVVVGATLLRLPPVDDALEPGDALGSPATA